MQVRVRDTRFDSWGHGLTRAIVRSVTIADTCPVCGGPRGTARNANQCDDGEFYSVDVWDNPCGHIDHYNAVLNEAERGLLPSRLLA